MDPFSVLGVTPGASPDEVAAAYRELAKAWHPDRRGEAGEERMAEINVAYELLRAGDVQDGLSRTAPAPVPARGKGAGLSPAVRRALGPEPFLRAGRAPDCRPPCGERSARSYSTRSRSTRMSGW